MSSKEQLLAEVETFLREAGITQSQFGQAAVNDRSFVSRLRKGSDVRLETADRVRAFIVAYSPHSGNGRSVGASAAA
jgi:predicted transcriptional regulator